LLPKKIQQQHEWLFFGEVAKSLFGWLIHLLRVYTSKAQLAMAIMCVCTKQP